MTGQRKWPGSVPVVEDPYGVGWRLSQSALGVARAGYNAFATGISLVSVSCGGKGEIPAVHSYRVILLKLVTP